MENIARQFSGWEVVEAIKCCADPDLLSACIAADRDWKDAGSPSRFSFLSEWLHGDDAYPHNQYQTRLREISARMSQTDTHLRYSLIEHLLAERIVAWGCRETPTAPPIAIPGPAWKYIYISSARNCIATEKTRAKTQIFNLRIFPIVESPDVVDRLNDKTFVEAFQMCLVDDPQLGAMREASNSLQRHASTIWRRMAPLPCRVAGGCERKSRYRVCQQVGREIPRDACGHSR
jgi:hypothetical protein